MYNVEVSKAVAQTVYQGDDALNIPAGKIVIAKVTEGIVKGSSGPLMRTDCDAHPFVELQTGNVWVDDLSPFTFEYVPNVIQIVLRPAKQLEL